jgi:hypothetical protein
MLNQKGNKMELKIVVCGNDIDGLVKALEEIKARVSIGSTIGTGANPAERCSYSFEVLPNQD